MTHTVNGHSVPGPRHAAPYAGRTPLELEADVLALVDETVIRTEISVNSGTVTLLRRQDDLGARLSRSAMFADVTGS